MIDILRHKEECAELQKRIISVESEITELNRKLRDLKENHHRLEIDYNYDELKDRYIVETHSNGCLYITKEFFHITEVFPKEGPFRHWKPDGNVIVYKCEEFSKKIYIDDDVVEYTFVDVCDMSTPICRLETWDYISKSDYEFERYQAERYVEKRYGKIK